MNIWRGRLHRWLAPAARRCPLSPNAITLLALAINIVAAALLYRRWFLVAIVLLAIGGLADAFDGVVARVQEKTSRYGDFLDHFADRVSDTLLLAGWLLGNEVRLEIALGAIIAIMLNGYLGTHRLNLGDGYALHGTQAVSQLGRSVSHGCVRLANEDIARLFDMASVGDEVVIY